MKPAWLAGSLLGVTLGLELAGTMLSASPAQSDSSPAPWQSITDRMKEAREHHTALLLNPASCHDAGAPPGYPCGKVMVIGGWKFGLVGGETEPVAITSAELFDPVSQTWQTLSAYPTSDIRTYTYTLSGFPQQFHYTDLEKGIRGVMLADGSVLAYTGGSSALYDPAHDTWRLCPQHPIRGCPGRLNTPRFGNSAGPPLTLISTSGCAPGCKALVAGGSSAPVQGKVLASAEMYDPSTGQWTYTVEGMNLPRDSYSATSLDPPACRQASPPPGYPCGRVLVVGGSDYSNTVLATQRSAEIFDPSVGGIWQLTTPPPFDKYLHDAALLADGRVLVAGGTFGGLVTPPGFQQSAEIYDPLYLTWTVAAPILRYAAIPFLTGLPDGSVLMAGGDAGRTDTWLYRPDPGAGQGTWTPAGALNQARPGLTSTLLGCDATGGRVLAAGGEASSDSGEYELASSELYSRVPTIKGMSPTTGPPAGGYPISIQGLGLKAGAIRVQIGSHAAANPTVNSQGTQITATVPAAALPGPAEVSVTVAGAAPDACGKTYVFTYAGDHPAAPASSGSSLPSPPSPEVPHLDPPSIRAISPSCGPTSGGTAVAVTGSHLAGRIVIFDGVPVAGTPDLAAPDAKITAVSPPHLPGVARVDVRTPDGEAPAPVPFVYPCPAASGQGPRGVAGGGAPPNQDHSRPTVSGGTGGGFGPGPSGGFVPGLANTSTPAGAPGFSQIPLTLTLAQPAGLVALPNPIPRETEAGRPAAGGDYAMVRRQSEAFVPWLTAAGLLAFLGCTVALRRVPAEGCGIRGECWPRPAPSIAG